MTGPATSRPLDAAPEPAIDLDLRREVVSLRQRATDKLRDAILAGHFAPGSRMIERDLWQSLGVSRTVLREALQHLQAEGLITIVPHKGPVVATIDAAEAAELYEVRRSLEALAGAGFARHATPQQIARLREALAWLASPAASATTAALLAAKNAFYDTLLEGCGNRVVGQVLRQLNNRITMLRRISLGRAGRLPETLAELEEIVRAIEARDAKRAARLCEAHVARAAAIALGAIEPLSSPAGTPAPRAPRRRPPR
ncbi:MAG: GntR family transcriptional regulator [Lautropia sp.]